MPAAYDWWLLALLSWVLAFLAFVVGTLVVFLGIRFWVWWVVVATLLGLGYMASLVPLNTWPARAWVKGVATAGLIFTILATIWVGVGVALRVAATPVQVAEAREELKNLRELPKRLAEEQAVRERAIREEQKRAAEAERQRLLTAERSVAIERRDEELARRFQRGDDRRPLPEIPPDGPPESMRRAKAAADAAAAARDQRRHAQVRPQPGRAGGAVAIRERS